jgi:S1-C subfamily serine protease
MYSSQGKQAVKMGKKGPSLGKGGKKGGARAGSRGGIIPPVVAIAAAAVGRSGGGPPVESHSFDLADISLEEAEMAMLAKSLRGVVQVFTNAVESSFAEPWTKSLPQASTGSGFVTDLKLRLVVTNAHVVEFARTILLRKNGDHVQYEAFLLAISHQVDIAILTVPDDKFWQGAETVTFGEMSRMQQSVDVVGYPVGGDTVSITRGVVSRIDWIPYAQSGGEGQLCVQVDAAINPGNSGGPALSNGKLVGICFQGLGSEEAANVGYIIPVPLLRRVLEDFKDQALRMGVPVDSDEDINWGEYEPSCNVPLIDLHSFARFVPKYQTAENVYLRVSVDISDDMCGIIIRDVPKTSNLSGVLCKNDVLLAIDGVQIGNDGRASVPPLQPMDFQYLISRKLAGEPMAMSVWRGGKVVELTVEAENPTRRTPLISKNPFTSFVMFAGFVFCPLAMDSEVGDNPIEDLIIKREILYQLALRHSEHTSVEQQTILLTTILPHRVSIGYDPSNLLTPLIKINDVVINKISDVAVAIASADGPLITFEFCNGDCIVLPVEEGRAATLEIQDDYGMKEIYSEDILEVLEEKVSLEF